MVEPAPADSHFFAMGTVVAVCVAIEEESQRAAAEGAIAEVRKLIQEFGVDGWAWGGGALGHFNRQLEAGFRPDIPPILLPMLERAWQIREASEGCFEPRIGRLVQLWGFDVPEHGRALPPPREAIETALARIRGAPPLDGGSGYGPAPGVAWDSGAIGKGYVTDLALEWLQHRGFGNAFVNAGGHVAARGWRGERRWKVGIRDPRPAPEPGGLIAEFEIGDESVVTHGDDQRYFEHAGCRYSHLLDPRTGWPARGLRSVTVVHRDGILADAGGAALFAAGPDDWPTLAARLGLDQVLAVTEAGELDVTDRLATRIRLTDRARRSVKR